MSEKKSPKIGDVIVIDLNDLLGSERLSEPSPIEVRVDDVDENFMVVYDEASQEHTRLRLSCTWYESWDDVPEDE